MEIIQHHLNNSSPLPLLSEEMTVTKAKKIELDIQLIDKIIRDDGFPLFVEHIFSQSVDVMKDGKWTGGAFPMDIADWMQKNNKTLRVSAKDHFKSMSFYAHIMWKIYRLYYLERNREINYFSYGEGMASYHLAKIKIAIKSNPYFDGIIDLKAQADSILSYTWDGKKRITVHPRGLLEFKRGIHCNDVYVDDPFQDPENKLVPTKIKKINDTMKTQILDMFQNECHIAGTAQTNHDFFFDDEFVSRFSRRILPAVVDEKNQIALWPEWMNWEELMAKRKERGEKVFNQEYRCSPVYSENAFFEKEKLMAVVSQLNKNFTFEEWEKEIEYRTKAKQTTDWDKVAGWDLGKKGHPAHFTVFEKRKVKDKTVRVQIHDKWFDHVDYTEQLQYIDGAIDAFNIQLVFYDATRGELEMLDETGQLRGEYEGVHFTFQRKNAMATAFDKAVTNKDIELLNSSRSIGQMLIVSNDLQAPVTPEGHGDSFMSTCMTFCDLESEGADIHFV